MDRIQATLTVEEGKELIAMGVVENPLVQEALKKGKVLLKGGTTVSKISEKLLGFPLRISGRITNRGTVASLQDVDGPHSIIIEKGKWYDIDETIASQVQRFGREDVIICGANAFDSEGRAAIMAGSPGGGNIGLSLSSWYTEGASVLIPVGIEKMIPGNLDNIISKTGRRGKKLSWGMAVGLMPLKGEIFTEIDAIKSLANVEAYAIGAGGLGEAQGSITLDIMGEEVELEKIIEIIRNIKATEHSVSGQEDSLTECEAICDSCKRHIGCGYKSGKL